MSTSTSVAALLRHNMRRVDIASELGLTPSAVTQSLAAHPAPVAEVSQEHAQLDATYDEIEAQLLVQLKRTIPMLLRPEAITNVLTRINAAKRRGGPLKNSDATPTILQLNLPVAIQNRFVLNSANQVVSAGNQDLVTIPSTAVARLAEQSRTQGIIDAPTKQTPSAASSLASELGFD